MKASPRLEKLKTGGSSPDMAHLFSIANACLLSPVQTDELFRLMRSPRFFANARNVSESSGMYY